MTRYPITRGEEARAAINQWSLVTGHAVYGWELVPSRTIIYRHRSTGRVMLLDSDGREIDQVQAATDAAAIALR